MREDFVRLLQRAAQKDASDIHIKVNSVPFFRVDGLVEPQEGKPLTPDVVQGYLEDLLNEGQMRYFQKTGEVDLAFTEKGVGRFRVNIFRQRGSVSIVLRRIKSKILSFEQLLLPYAVQRFAEMQRGLVLVTGTTGSGKSTTLASIIDYINSTRKCHVVTIEDPIEYVHYDRMAVISQREVTIDTQDFTTALRSVMRQDPDVILIGEMRDVETFQAAISASETGHLVFSTLHTTNSVQTIDRIIDLFPSTQQDQIRSQLAINLRAMMCMRLIARADGVGRVPACEVMFATPGVQSLIRENRIKMVETAIRQGREEGMQTFNDSLHGLIKAKLISLEEGLRWSDNPEELRMMLQGIRLSSKEGGLLR
ncbi:MAG TPA: type IV pilus twitching motility protein PilT [Candidatus Hydrogenedentes bacterium]|mgnify:CR=1 FL=1|nr:type IV pilus twitching motility protein PilT [Candidatus Hydrogenedentota bacterium]HPG68443.1 type IV pilus twitching motility protein PilT [Candidatus Hydrogenedentota bacterium]